MNKEEINNLIRDEALRFREVDKERIKSMIKSALTNAKVVRSITLNEETATVIFRETYESIRQLGNALWWLLGYEPLTHDVSMRILKEQNIANKIKLNSLDRFKKIRNDINYRGFKATITQAKEITEFWNDCANDIINMIKRKVPINEKR